MQRKKIVILFAILTFLGVIAWWFYKDRDELSLYIAKNHLKNERQSYFLPISARINSYDNRSSLDIYIEGERVSALLDLGFYGQLSVNAEVLDKVSKKEKVHLTKTYDFRGNQYLRNIYKTSEIKIGPLVFCDIYMSEEAEGFKKNTNFHSSVENGPNYDKASVGWKVFMTSNLFLDLGNSKAAYADSINSILKNGYSALDFVRVPMMLDRGLIECFLVLDGTKTRCILDTGSTLNCLNEELPEDRSLEDVLFDGNYFKKYQSVNIQKKNFGTIKFKPFPIKAPLQVDAILGMEFFKSHCVFIDFAEKTLYFARNPN